jgi:hypothetical protein
MMKFWNCWCLFEERKSFFASSRPRYNTATDLSYRPISCHDVWAICVIWVTRTGDRKEGIYRGLLTCKLMNFIRFRKTATSRAMWLASLSSQHHTVHVSINIKCFSIMETFRNTAVNWSVFPSRFSVFSRQRSREANLCSTGRPDLRVRIHSIWDKSLYFFISYDRLCSLPVWLMTTNELHSWRVLNPLIINIFVIKFILNCTTTVIEVEAYFLIAYIATKLQINL